MVGLYNFYLLCIGIDFYAHSNDQRIGNRSFLQDLGNYTQQFMVMMSNSHQMLLIWCLYGIIHVLFCIKQAPYYSLILSLSVLGMIHVIKDSKPYMELIVDKFNRYYRPYIYGQPEPSFRHVSNWDIDEQGQIIGFPMPSTAEDIIT
jgi:hypothetical protein